MILFLLGIILCIIGLTFWLLYLNIFAIGGGLIDYLWYVFKCFFCWFLPVGIIILYKIKK